MQRLPEVGWIEGGNTASADLIDDTGALADQSRAHALQRLQIELLGSLGGDELQVPAGIRPGAPVAGRAAALNPI